MNYKISYYHNEIELIRSDNQELKNKIEKAFLRNRISYFIRWDKPGFFRRILGKRESEYFKICINDWDKEKALDILKEFDSLIADKGEFLLKRTESALSSDLYVHKQV